MPAKGATDSYSYDAEFGLGIHEGLIICVAPLVFEGGDLQDKIIRCFRDGMSLLFTYPRRARSV